MSQLGNQIMRLRTNRGWSQRELAAKINACVSGASFNNSVISKYESGMLKVPSDLIVPLCGIFQVTPNILHEYEDNDLVGMLRNELESTKKLLEESNRFRDNILKVIKSM